jgi:hypothetical protein
MQYNITILQQQSWFDSLRKREIDIDRKDILALV